MKDISKCEGTGCTKRDSCIRFTNPVRPKFQSWVFMKVAIPDVAKCRFYWPEDKADGSTMGNPV